MTILFLFGIFESFLFPRAILFESRFNPATLHKAKFELVTGIEQRFNLTELRSYTIHSQFKSYSLDITSFGSNLYRENILDLGYGFGILKNLAFGLDISLLNYWIKDNYSRFSYSVKIGSLYEVKQLEIGTWINNINMAKFSDIDYLPPSYSAIFNYLATETLSLNFKINGLKDELPFFDLGIACTPYRIIHIAAGVNTEPLLFEYGMMLHLGNFILIYSGNTHLQLGQSHLIGINFSP